MTGNDIFINLSTPPKISYFYEHYFYDYIEVLALVVNTDVVSLSDVIKRFANEDETNVQENNNHNQDVWESRVTAWFSGLAVRKHEFIGFYPFEIEAHTIRLKDNLNNEHYFYLLLLLSSNLNYINRSFRHLLTTDFESVASKAFKQYLPQLSEIHKFGKSSDTNDRYNGKIKEKIDLFAEDLKLTVCYKEHFFSPYDNGDYGIDIVAWIPFYSDNSLLYIQVFLAQCATGKNWLEKQDEPLKIHNSIAGLDKAINTLFIPYDARNINREFSEEAKIRTQLLFDRFRLISLLKSDLEFIEKLNSFNDVVLKAVDFEEDIV